MERLQGGAAVLVVLEFTDTNEREEGSLAGVWSTLGVRSCFDRLFLIRCVFAEESNSIWHGTSVTPDQLNLQKKAFWSQCCFSLHRNSFHYTLTDIWVIRQGRPEVSKFTGHGFKERSSLSLRASRRCYWAAAWTGNFRGLAHTRTRTPLHEHLNNEHCWWTLVLEAAIIQKMLKIVLPRCGIGSILNLCDDADADGRECVCVCWLGVSTGGIVFTKTNPTTHSASLDFYSTLRQ